MAQQNVLVVGLGAVGAIFAYSLYRSDRVRLTIVARGNYNLINEEGLHIKSQRYGEITGWKPHRIVNSIATAADTQYSYVILATKCVPDIIKTPKILEPLLSSPYCDLFAQPTYVLLQNGLNIEVDLYHSLKALNVEKPRIVNAGVYVFANMIGQNIIEHGPFARLDIGVYRPNDLTTTTNSPDEQQVLDELKSLFWNADINIYPEIQRKKFEKNMLNIGYSSLACLTRCGLPALYRSPPTDIPYEFYLEPATADSVRYTHKWLEDILKECVRLGHAIGIPESEDGLPPGIVEKILKNNAKIYSDPHSNHVPSTLLDIEKGAPIEVEVIWGEVVRMAKEKNVDIPRIEMAYALLVLIQNQILRRINSGKAAQE